MNIQQQNSNNNLQNNNQYMQQPEFQSYNQQIQYEMSFNQYMPNQFQQNQFGQYNMMSQDQYQQEEYQDQEEEEYEEEQEYNDEQDDQEQIPESWDQNIQQDKEKYYQEQYQNYLKQQQEQQQLLYQQQLAQQQALLQQQEQQKLAQQQSEQPKQKKKLVLKKDNDFIPASQKQETLPQQQQQDQFSLQSLQVGLPVQQQQPSLQPQFDLSSLGNFGNLSLGNNQPQFRQQQFVQPQFGLQQLGQFQYGGIQQQPISFEQFMKQQVDNSEDDNVQFGFDSSKGVASFDSKTLGNKKATKKDIKKAQPQIEVKPKVIKRIQKIIESTDNTEQASMIQKIKKRKPKADRYTEDDIASWDFDSKYMSVDVRKKPVNIVFVGHVDVGKSTICGNILLLCGKVDETDLRKYEQEAKEKCRDSWYLAYIMDINEEERNKGKTVEVGKATFQTENRRFTLLDAPGHKNYVPNMIQGAAQADIAAMVISAKTGEFESGFEKGGQTREHAMLIRCIGVQNVIILINKMDEVDWSKERFDYIKDQLSIFLKSSVGYDIEKQVTWIPITGLMGGNLLKRVDKSVCPWYDGPTLFEVLDDCNIPKRNPNGPVRVPVMDRLKDQGGVFITGKVESGIIKQDMELTLLPFEADFQILSIQNADDERVYYAKPGENVKIKIKGLEEKDIEKGYMICTQDDYCQVTNEFEANVDVLELPEHKSIMSSGYQAVLHIHCAAEECEISFIKAKYDEQKKNYVTATFLKSNMKAIVRVKTYKNICVEKYEINPQLGSFTIRDEGKTIALGQITKVKPAKKQGPVLDAKIIEQIKLGQDQLDKKKEQDQQIEIKE